MKTKLFFILYIAFSFNSAIAQIIPDPVDSTQQTISIGEIKIFGEHYADCKMYVKKGDTTITIFYRNVTYKTILDSKTITFKETGKDLQKLYDIIYTNLQSTERKEITIPIIEGSLKLIFDKKSVQFTTYENGIYSYSIYFKQKHINTLFGKTN